MKPIMQRAVEILVSLTVCVLLSSCCGLCKKCPDAAECTTTPSNAATNVKSAAGKPTSTDDQDDEHSSLPVGSRVSYPLFEGDYFSVTLPAPSVPRAEPENSETVTAVDPMEVWKPWKDLIPILRSGIASLEATTETIEPAEEYIGLWKAVLVFLEDIDVQIGELYTRRTVEDVVSHMGFTNPSSGEDILRKEFFDVKPHVMKLGGGDILKVADINCETRPTTNPNSFCKLNDDQRNELIKRATGMAAEDYLDRKLTHYFFYQRPQYREWPTDPESSEKSCVRNTAGKCIDVFIEHSVLAATIRPDYSVASVKGRVFSSYKITNQRKLTPAKAMKIAYKQLWDIPGISEYGHTPDTKQELPLVLLPYGHTRKFDLERLTSFKWPSKKTPQLRYAFRTTLWGNYTVGTEPAVEAVSWRAWVDAETGDILQLIPQFAFADGVKVNGKGWPLHPSYPVAADNCTPGDDDCPTESTFNVDLPGTGSEDCECPPGSNPDTQYCLKLDGVFDQLRYPGDVTGPSVVCSATGDFAAGLDCQTPWECLCDVKNEQYQSIHYDHKASSYLHMNAYAHAFAFKKKLDEAICGSAGDGNQDIPSELCVGGEFQAAKNDTSGPYVPLRIEVDNGPSAGFYVRGFTDEGKPDEEELLPHLSLGSAGRLTNKSCTDRVRAEGSTRPGAQDATLIIHEFAHIVMDGLLASRPDDWCGLEDAACPVSLSADIVHDMADGLSAVSNITNGFGTWWGDDDQEYLEAGGAYREFDYSVDRFPDHRIEIRKNLKKKEQTFLNKGYADGQIAAAALWAVTESMNKWVDEFGPGAFETILLNVLPNHFIPNACRAFKQGEDCDYPDNCDLDVYRYLHFLLDDLISNDLTTDVTVTSNKIAAGFAKAGIFLVPAQCLGAKTDADPPEVANSYCPTDEFGERKEYGGDAVIDITDNWLNHNDPSDLPEFEVWTGPKFRFDDNNEAFLAETPPCNKYFRIRIANNAGFDDDSTRHHYSQDTGWLSTSDFGEEECEATWKLDKDDDQWMPFWTNIIRTSRDPNRNPDLKFSNVYYLVETSNSATDTPPSSSEYPGKPRWGASDQRVDPPFAVLNDTGRQQPELLD